MPHDDPRTKNQLPEANSIQEYLKEYSATVHAALEKVPAASLEKALDLLVGCLRGKKRIYSAGNGGSATIADHLVCDWVKGTATEHSHLKVAPLAGSVSLFTALANDYGYDHTFSYPLEVHGEAGDVVVLISSSGNSANIVKAAEAAKKRGVKVIGFTGFEGGRLKELSDVSLHVPLHNYGMVEDAHQTLMHTLAQFLLRKKQKEKL